MLFDLFKKAEVNEKLHPKLRMLLDSEAHVPAKQIMNHYFNLLGNKDKNFIQQFRSDGFDSRTFELGMFAFLASLDFKFDKTFSSPDFIIEKRGLKVCVEATTTNPQVEDKFRNSIENVVQLEPSELSSKVRNEVPIRFGSALQSKLSKKYWQLPQCQNKPFVIAIQAFHEAGSLTFMDDTLIAYLYGRSKYPQVDPDFTDEDPFIVKDHEFEGKIIPSNFFSQPGTENISAVIFSNSLTISKFVRMTYISGFRNGVIKRIIRNGICHDHDDEYGLPISFVYDLDNSPHTETWGEGLHLIHNPSALFPLPTDYFGSIAETRLINGEIVTRIPGFHPYANMSNVEI